MGGDGFRAAAGPPPAIVLVEPLIPGNTGTIARTCAALRVDLCLVGPLGFDLSDRAVRRAGLDYWPHVPLHRFEGWDDFLARRAPPEDALFPFEEFGATSVYHVDWPAGAHLVFGTETTGLPPAVLDGRRDRTVRLPMRSPHVRSLNLSNAVTAAAYVAFRGLLGG
ncbi:tRNA (cytidine(34)-2'-O)-methyltransferase [Jannaschia sp. LMIT008]|uniref:tRNA (cytidine(34)-2'-O)-methyltransferase n=1 Tax=Jannaschia maritima TaxID=3032585 RepID=UPI00281214D7|nr:tRNA (cytidine(34)-2'-O)-methyltransferase [Jannaschia sp. LMIT008]